MNVLFIQNQLCSRGWKEARVLGEEGIDISLLELGSPSENKDHSIFKESFTIPIEPDIGSMVKGRARIVRELKRIVKQGTYDLVHVHNEPDNLGVLVKKNLSVPLVHDIHDLVSLKPITWASGPKRWAIRRMVNSWEKYVCKKADGILSTSKLMMDHIRKEYRPKRIDYVENKPVREDDLKVQPKIDDGKVHMVYPGGISLEPEGNRYLWPMFEKICSSGVEVHLYPSVFETSQREAVRKKCSRIPNLHYHLPVAQDKVIHEISKYHYGLVLFSGFTKNILMATSNRVFEYQIAGLPVITNDVGLIGDYVKKKGCGEVIGDVNEIEGIIKGKRDYDLDKSDCFMEAGPILELYREIISHR